MLNIFMLFYCIALKGKANETQAKPNRDHAKGICEIGYRMMLRRGDSSYPWHGGAMSLSSVLVMSIPSIAKAKILLCATFNAQVAEHFSQILPFTFPSAADRERIVITSVSVCLSVSLPHRGNVSTCHSPPLICCLPCDTHVDTHAHRREIYTIYLSYLLAILFVKSAAMQ